MNFKRFEEQEGNRFYSYSWILDLSNFVTGNELYAAKSVGFRRAYIYKTTKAKNFQQEIEDNLEMLPEDVKLKIKKYSIEILFLTNWYFKNNNVKRIDLTNLEKVVEDAICKKLGIDDSYCFKKITEKAITNEDLNSRMKIFFKIDFYE